jgi:predicted lipoprotein with Yx(FWY)xxD motif
MTLRSTSTGRLTATALAGLVALAACGDDPAPLAASAQTTTTTATSAAGHTAPSGAAVKISPTEIGDVLADPNGMTLYAFTNDVEAKSTCYGTCAEAWPPVIVGEDFVVSPGLDSGVFATTVRDDGQLQLVAGKFPLYLFAADAKPGDITGQGSGDVWFAVDPAGRLISGDQATDDIPYGSEPSGGETYGGDTTTPAESASDAGSAAIDVAESDRGTILTDADGMTLYLFTPDESGAPTCTGGCAGAWPPLIVDGSVVAPDGIDPSLLSTVEHPDGGVQLKVGKWPLYRFSGDTVPGETNGQGSGGNWFLVGPDGKAVK